MVSYKVIEFKKAKKIANKILRECKIDKVDIAFVLGSGLADSLPCLDEKKVFDYKKLGLGGSAVKGHVGRFIVGKCQSKNVVFFTRFHYYESESLPKVRLPYEVVSALGAKLVVITTSCGAINKSFVPGDIMCICDHINNTGTNPLLAFQPIEFVDCKKSYSKELIDLIACECEKNNINLKKGVFVQFSGPSYETPAEVKLARLWGADAVSMSTALDIILCSALDMKQIAFSCITNYASDINEKEITHDDVLEIGALISKKLKIVFDLVISNFE